MMISQDQKCDACHVQSRGVETWVCSQLCPGASCRMRGYRKAQDRSKKLPPEQEAARKLPSSREERKRTALERDRQACEYVRLCADAKRAKRAEDRAQGISAADRYTPGEMLTAVVQQVLCCDSHSDFHPRSNVVVKMSVRNALQGRLLSLYHHSRLERNPSIGRVQKIPVKNPFKGRASVQGAAAASPHGVSDLQRCVDACR
jgi:hypothetical protein